MNSFAIQDKDEHLWCYQDPSGKIHGDFSDQQMNEWYQLKIYFQDDLLLRRKCDEGLRTLAEYLSLFDGAPFDSNKRIPPLIYENGYCKENSYNLNENLSKQFSRVSVSDTSMDDILMSSKSNLARLLNISNNGIGNKNNINSDTELSDGHFSTSWHSSTFYSSNNCTKSHPAWNHTAAFRTQNSQSRDSAASDLFTSSFNKTPDKSKISDSESCANSTSSSKQSVNPAFSLIYGLQTRENTATISTLEMEKIFGTQDPVSLAQAFNNSPEFFAAPPLEAQVPFHRPPPPLPTSMLKDYSCDNSFDPSYSTDPNTWSGHAHEGLMKPKLSLDSRAPGYRPPGEKTEKSKKKLSTIIVETNQQHENNRQDHSPTPAKSLKQELNELIQWVKSALQGINTNNIDVPTAVEVLACIDAPYEIESMFHSYLGDSPRVNQFVREFLDRRRPYWQLHKKQHKPENIKKKKLEILSNSTKGIGRSASHDRQAPSLTSNNINGDSSPDLSASNEDSLNNSGQWKHIKTKKLKSTVKSSSHTNKQNASLQQKRTQPRS